MPRGTLAKIEAGIRGIADIELFVLARVLGVKWKNCFRRASARDSKVGNSRSGSRFDDLVPLFLGFSRSSLL